MITVEGVRKGPLAAVALLGVLAGFLAGCESLQQLTAGIEKPSASIAGVRFDGLTLEGVQMVFDVKVSNPYAFDLPLAAFDYALGSPAAAPAVTGSVEASQSIPARGATTVAVPVGLTFARLLETLKDVRPGALVPYDAAVRFHFKPPGLAPIALPVRHQGELPVPAAPQVRLTNLQWSELSLTKAAGLLQLQVDNPNAFGFDLSALAFDLSLGGQRLARVAMEQPAKLGAGQGAPIDIPLSISPSSLGLAALNLLRSEKANYELVGQMRLATPYGALGVPLNRRGELPMVR